VTDGDVGSSDWFGVEQLSKTKTPRRSACVGSQIAKTDSLSSDTFENGMLIRFIRKPHLPLDKNASPSASQHEYSDNKNRSNHKVGTDADCEDRSIFFFAHCPTTNRKQSARPQRYNGCGREYRRCE
jgi:hypothetical protein